MVSFKNVHTPVESGAKPLPFTPFQIPENLAEFFTFKLGTKIRKYKGLYYMPLRVDPIKYLFLLKTRI